VAGKTGTAQKVVDQRYSKSHWVSSFVGYLPAEDPRIVIGVIIDEPKTHHYGGVVAAPVFKNIADASLDHLHIRREFLSVESAAPVVADGGGDGRGGNRPEPGRFDGSMPDLRGMSLRAALRALSGCDCSVNVDGSGFIVSQRPDAGAVLGGGAPVASTLARHTAP
jgi:cell division protein FtsI (penicillin-binding protein 3)